MATPTNLPASFSTAQVLTAGQMNDLRGAFRVLQVVSATTTTQVSSSSVTYQDTTLTVTITPQSSSSKIFIMTNQSFYHDTATGNSSVRLVRNSTTLQDLADPIYSSAGGISGNVSFLYLDSPATTSATTYKTTFARRIGSGTFTAQVNFNVANITVFEVSA
jgi:hypothetical protein